MEGRARRGMVSGVPAWVLVVAVAVGLVGVAWAGLEPTPFEPATNQVNAVANVLGALDGTLEAKLSIPPDDIMPAPEGLIGEFDAMAQTLEVQQGRVQAAIEAVMSVPPDPVTPEFEDALAEVGSVASGISERVDAVLAIPPDPIHPNLLEALAALEGVGAAALAIVETAGSYSGTPGY